MKYISGEILTNKKIVKGYITINEKKIIDLSRGEPPKKPIFKGLIIPKLINMHTHIGDSFIKNKNIKLPRDIEKLVAPPDGLKHRLLNNAEEDDIITGMEKSIETMIKNGTSLFCDFREDGILGICQLKAALYLHNISSIMLSRPDSLDYNKNEVDLLLKNSDGIALSSISEWDFSKIKKIADQTHKKNKIFALHASERVREDLDEILDLKPKFLVHMLKATKSDLIRLKENKIPIIICPRANLFFDLKPNYKLLKDTKTNFLLGTDNAMLNSSNIIDEINFLRRETNLFSIGELLYNNTYNARKVLNLDCNILCANSKANFVVLDKKNLKPLFISTAE